MSHKKSDRKKECIWNSNSMKLSDFTVSKKLLHYVNTINNNIDTLEKESRSTR